MKRIEIVSQIINVLKLNNRDDRVSRRFILSLLEDSATTYISQKFGERSILAETNLYSYIPCFEFNQINSKTCDTIEFRLCNILMKSKKPLPKLIFSRLGSSIREIVSLDGNFTFTFVDEVQYRRNKKRQYKLKNEVYVYLGVDNHLYIPDQEIFTVDLTVLTTEVDKISECSSCTEEDNCRSKWEYEFIVPQKLIKPVVDDVLQKMGLNRQIKADESPNNVSGA
jgi:hypothetical protein